MKNRTNRKVPVTGYEPSSHEEYLVWEIAKHVEDTDMRPLLKILRHHGLSVIERAYQEFRNLEDVMDFKSKPAFFTYLIKKQITMKGGSNMMRS